MKKGILLVIVIFIISGCSQIENVNVDNPSTPDNGGENSIDGDRVLDNEGSSQGDIEEDINAEDLQEDKDLTEVAEDEGKTEEDTLLPQEEVEEKKEEKSENI